ncbi:50S ribosomal protein L11 methyltransferase [Cellulophaga sp. 20_2_10]|uniref:50S ribosomal protein L11 methyltransferase n=1 Tax=Cellulophaga sp. 20_2_10 TaxID=2942476 RepID=UPI00201AD1DB|nr:50S ribosomal protein L11 methyltransferase [Cellulophaga sp. 20_2_10]MCL5245279.1 50S ribosomal protein L11 methyltransferase [Cellulophaga sp. 20_2_10]
MADLIYIEYNFTVAPLQPASDILIAQLGEIGFDSFVENEEGVQAYILKDLWKEDSVKDVQILTNENFNISYNFKEIEQQNWNSEWEKNFEKIVVEDICTVRAPFHEKPNTEFDIVIEPKMSFGTGHHETTHMMLQHILEHDFKGKSVLDMGSGTGVLAILAAMKNASSIDAIDIDNWCYLNAVENKERNNCNQINVFEGDVSLLKDQKYNIIIANINRNILLADIPAYAKRLTEDGILFLSGFYKEDIPVITEKCSEAGLKFEKNLEKNNWVAVKYVF